MSEAVENIISSLTESLASRAEGQQILDECALVIAESMGAESCEVVFFDSGHSFKGRAFTKEPRRNEFVHLQLEGRAITADSQPLPLPLFVSTDNSVSFHQPFSEMLRVLKIECLAVVALAIEDQCVGWIQCIRSTSPKGWPQSDVIKLLGLAQKTSELLSVAVKSEKFTLPKHVSDLCSAPFPVLYASSAGQYLGANDCAVAQLQVAPGEQSLTSQLSRFLSPDQVQRVQAKFIEFCDGDSSCGAYDVEGGVHYSGGQFRDVSLYFVKLQESSRGIALLFLPGRRLYLQSELTELRLQYRRLVDYTGAVVVRTDTRLIITGVSGDCRRVLGIEAADLLFSRLASNPYLQKLIPEKQRTKLIRQFRRYMTLRVPIQDEFLSSLECEESRRWFSVVAVPVYGRSEEAIAGQQGETDTRHLGWEVILKDVTDAKRIAQEKEAQEKRLNALYEVAKALEFNSEAAEVTSRGLEALMKATDATSGFVAFFDRTTRALRLAASNGLSDEFAQSIERRIQGTSSLTRSVVESGEGVIVDDLYKDFRVDRQLAIDHATRSVLMVPLVYEDNPLGVVAIFSKEESFFSQADFNLAAISASQICLAARRAEFYMAEKRQASALAALYRLSHELSKYHSSRDIAHHSFTVIQDELACKRMWLGTLDESGNYVAGQAGAGPGVRRYLQTLHVELGDQNRFLKEAFELKQPIIVETGAEVGCAALARIMRKLEVGTFIIVPLIALGENVGVLVVEPVSTSTFFSQKKLPLLSSMASEIATVILARRFESQVAETEKMRMAGLLASGVAHNFNNLLQAVLGQASLLEMQLPKGSPLQDSARVIIDAANRGATLINHLLGLSDSRGGKRVDIDCLRLLRRDEKLYRSLLGEKISLEIAALKQHLPVSIDEGLIQQVLTSLLLNAREALSGRDSGEVHIIADRVEIQPGDVRAGVMPGSYVRIEVIDNGPGMPVEQLERCFEPFFSTKSQDRETGLSPVGSGLGLSSAYSIVQKHQGTLRVRSSVGGGTVFTMLLPLAESNVLEFAHPAFAASGPKSRQPHVVLVDFGDSEAQELTSLFQTMGAAVRVESSWNKVCNDLLSLEGRDPAPLLILDVEDQVEQVSHRLEWITQHAQNCNVVVTCGQDELGALRSLSGDFKLKFELVQKPLGVWKLHQLTKAAFVGHNQQRTVIAAQ